MVTCRGFIDEHLLQRGLSHLIEHLALAELDVHFGYNGEPYNTLIRSSIVSNPSKPGILSRRRSA